jgi:hypothetical protein
MFFVDGIFIVFSDKRVGGIVSPLAFFDGVSFDFMDYLPSTT